MKKIRLIGGFFIVSALCMAGCQSKDAEIKSKVDVAVEADDVHSDVKDGVVTLTGQVKTPADKARAEADAAKIAGVEKVNNEIIIETPPPPPVPDRDELADDKLNKEVQAVIAPFPDVQASVNNGIVTLTGKITRPGMVLLMPKVAGLFPKKIENKLVTK